MRRRTPGSLAASVRRPPARIPYGAGVSLKTLAPGRYVLRVTISDREANESRISEVLFEVE